MITEAILEKAKGFPLQYQQEIVDFIEEKKVRAIEPQKRKFGSIKGIVT
jgi:hypothetical protein